jgi:RAD51-like protein 1
VDSVAALARAQFGRGQLTQRQELLGQIASALKQLSERLGMAAFVTNQVTTRWGGKRAGHEGLKEDGDADAGSVTAALGTKWAHCVNTRLVLEGAEGAEGADGKANDGEDAGYHQRRRVIKVVKSPRCPLVGFECDVYAGGIRVDGDKVVKVDPSGADAQGGIRGIYQGAAV